MADKLKELTSRKPEDDDVSAERARMQAGEGKDDLIRLEGLRKVYNTGKIAVHDLWYTVPKNQCFGFLGVNGTPEQHSRQRSHKI